MGRDSENSNTSTQMNFEEKLISAIQKQACLFNKHSVSYRKRAVKQKAWHKVAADVRSDVKECQHRWRSLRDRYVREMRAKPNCKWRYMSQLAFLKPHLDSRNNSNADCMTDEESCSNSEPYTATEYEENKNYLKELIPQLPVPKFEGKIETDVDDIPVEIEDIPSEAEEVTDVMGFFSFPSGNNATEITTINEAKKRRLDSIESNERLGMYSKVSSAADISSTDAVKSRNEYYYKTLDSYMLKLPLNVQDDLKIELLNRVYNEVKKY